MVIFNGAYEAPQIDEPSESIVWNLKRIRSKDYLTLAYRFSCLLDVYVPEDYTNKVMVF